MRDLFTAVDLTQPYLTGQLIPYIGNKRRLLPFLHDIFAELSEGLHAPVFIDPFAGSGSVSRLAKVMGMEVHANDWEPYTEVLNGCYIGLDKADLDRLFARRGGIGGVIDALNGDRGTFTPFISAFYAPKSLETADYRTERLFYTPENAKTIDRIRGRIDEWFPEEGPERTVLLAALVLQAAVRSNTSGVFKACHKGFGGHGKDALGRIMAPLRLVRPSLIDGRVRGGVYRQDAAEFAAGHPADICYLDPPYNIHQYGSNYHLLNTITRWDFPGVDNELGEDGRLREKAAIRRDWTATRSPFCSRKEAPGALRRLLESVDARFIVLSYNTEGIIPFEELYDILASRGAVEVKMRDYTLYRGGRQSLHRKVSNMEIQLICRSGVPAPSSADLPKAFIARRRLFMLLREPFVPERLAARFETTGNHVTLRPGLTVPTVGLYRFEEMPNPRDVEQLPPEEAEKIAGLLEEAACADREEECRVLTGLLRLEASGRDRTYFRRRLLQALRKFAHRKYRESFRRVVEDLRQAIKEEPESFGGIEKRLDEIEDLAERRFNG